MNPVAELLGAVSSGVEVRPVSRPQKGSGEFQLLLDQARRALQSKGAAAEAPPEGGASQPEGEASQPAEGGGRLLRGRPAELQGELPQEAPADAGEPADPLAAESSPAGSGGESAGLSVTAALIAVSTEAAPPAQLEVAAAAEGDGLVNAVAQPEATPPALGSRGARPAVEAPQPLPGHETGWNPSGSQQSGQAPAVHAAPREQPGETALLPARGLAGRRVQTGADPGRVARAQSGELSLAATRSPGTERAQPFARAVQGSPQELAPGPDGAQPQSPASARSPVLDGVRSQLAFLFRSVEAAPVKEAAALDTPVGLQPDARPVEPAARGKLEAELLGAEELPGAAPNDAASDAEPAARPAREGAGQLQRQDGAFASRTEPPPQGEAAPSPSLPGYPRAGQAFEGGRLAPLARPALQQMVRSAQAQIGDEVSTLHLQLRPENLGDLDLKLSVEHGVVTAKFVTHSLEVKALIESALPELRQSLQEQGVSVYQLTVSVGEERRGWGDSGRDASEQRGATGTGSIGRTSLEAAPSAAAAAPARRWYSQGVDILV